MYVIIRHWLHYDLTTALGINTQLVTGSFLKRWPCVQCDDRYSLKM